MKTVVGCVNAEAEIEHPQLALLHRAISSTHSGVTIARVSGGQRLLIYANSAFYRLTGFAADEVIGNDCRFLQGELTQQPGLQTLRTALAQQVEATVLLRNYRKDGSEFWNELTVSPVLDESGILTHYVGIQHDVTQRETDAQAIAKLNLELSRKSEDLALANEALRSFASSASHDLRVPLSSIKGFCSLLRKTIAAEQNSRADHYMARIEANANRMELLIKAMLKLAYATSSPLSFISCDLSLMAREVVDASQIASPELNAEVHIEPGLLAFGDPSLLQSVLQNLIGNALKYSSKTPGATVHFGRETDSEAEPRFFVRDNGAGFDMKSATTLFGAFQRFHSESDYAGTGVGLATVRRIVTRHGGVVSAESTPGAGAVFYFTIGTPLPQ